MNTPHLEVGTIWQHARKDGNAPTNYGPATGIVVRYRCKPYDPVADETAAHADYIDLIWANNQLVIIGDVTVANIRPDEIRIAYTPEGVLPPYPTIENIAYTDDELRDIGRAVVNHLRVKAVKP